MIGRFGVVELVLILVIALVIFGPKKLPEIGKAIGQSIREFRSSTATKEEDDRNQHNNGAQLSDSSSGNESESSTDSKPHANQGSERRES